MQMPSKRPSKREMINDLVKVVDSYDHEHLVAIAKEVERRELELCNLAEITEAWEGQCASETELYEPLAGEPGKDDK